MKLLSVMQSLCIAVAVLLCAVFPVAAVTTGAVSDIADPVMVATEPEEIDEKIYYYQGEEKVTPDTFKWVKGRHGKALQLNGKDQYLRYSAEKTLQLEEFTFSTWIKLRGSKGNVGQKLLTLYKNESMFLTVSPHILNAERAIDGIYMEWQDREMDPVILHSDPGKHTTFALESGVWHHMAVVVSNTEFSLYIDGIRFYSADVNTSLIEQELNTFLIGGGFYSEPLLNAQLDDAYLYPQALEASHIALLAADMDPADGGKAPTKDKGSYRPTAPSTTTAPTVPVEADDKTAIPPFVILLPIVLAVIIIVLSVLFSHQKKQKAAPSDEGETVSVLGQPETPVDPEEDEDEDGEPAIRLTEEEIQAAEKEGEQE